MKPGESQTYVAEIPEGEYPKEIHLDMAVETFDDPAIVITFLAAVVSFGFAVGSLLGQLVG